MAIFSNVKWFPTEHKTVVGRGSVTIHDTVRVNFSVLRGSNGEFVSLPREKATKPEPDGSFKYFDQVTMVSKELKEQLNIFILDHVHGRGETSDSQTTEAPPARKSAGNNSNRKGALPF